MKTSRRDFITRSVLATAGITTGIQALAQAGQERSHTTIPPAGPAPGAFTINIFSKNLQWLDYTGMAEAAAEMGFDGIDLTVRPNGHVLPERVAEDLPKAVAAVKKAGLNVHMITTAITSADEPHTENILKTAKALGISYYRMGWISYDSTKSMDDNLKKIKVQITKLAALNKRYGIHGGYQNHSGSFFGAPVWDLAMTIKDLDPQVIGSQYDVLHATAEGANSWPLGLKLIHKHVKTMDIKDFYWIKKDGVWKEEVVPLGEGLVDFTTYFKIIKEYNISGPFSIHYEYNLGGAENGGKTITKPREEVLAAMKKDVITLRRMLKDSGLAPG